MSHTDFQGPIRGKAVIAGAHASSGGAIYFNFGDKTPPQAIQPFSTIPFPPDPKFVQRTDVILWLRDQIASPGSRAALVGLGGIGKSQVAIHYAHEVRQASPDTFVFWVHASSKARFEEAYRIIANKLQLPGRDDPKCNVLQLVYTWLCDEENGPWMMVLDNADSVEVFFPSQDDATSSDKPLAAFLPKTGRGSIVITSRTISAAERLAGLDAIYKVPTMDKSQALQLLHNSLGEECGNGSVMTDLISALDYMPLAITQAAAYIKRRRPRMSVSAYLDEFRRSDTKRTSLLNRDGGDLRRDESAPNPTITTWQTTSEQIRHERPSAADLLSFMSFSNPQGIPEFALQAYIHDYQEDMEGDLNEDLEVLRTYSLVAVTAESDVFEMHALVQFCMRAWLSFGTRQQWKQKFLKVMANQYPPGEYENWTKCQRLDPHIEGVVKEEQSEDILAWATLLTNMGWYRWRRGMYKEAGEANQQALEIRERVLGRQHQDSTLNIHILAVVRQDQGKYEEAEQMHRRVLDARKIIQGREHPDTLTSMNNLASALKDQGKYEEAEQIHQQALNARKIILGREHPDTLASMNNLALVLRDQGKCEEAEQIYRQVLDAAEIILGGKHPNTLTSMNNLALVLRDQGKYEEAEQMHRQVLDAMEIILGGKHPSTLTGMDNLALVLQDQGKYEEAEQMHRQVLDAAEIILGRKHPGTLTSVYNLAYLFHKQTRFIEAAQLYERACNGYTDVFGSNHPITKTCVANFDFLKEAMANNDCNHQEQPALEEAVERLA